MAATNPMLADTSGRQSEIWGSDLGPDLGQDFEGFQQAAQLQRKILSSRNGGARPLKLSPEPRVRSPWKGGIDPSAARAAAPLGRRGLVEREGCMKATHKNLSCMHRDSEEFRQGAQTAMKETTLETAWEREQEDIRASEMRLPADVLPSISSPTMKLGVSLEMAGARLAAPSHMYTMEPLPTSCRGVIASGFGGSSFVQGHYSSRFGKRTHQHRVGGRPGGRGQGSKKAGSKRGGRRKGAASRRPKDIRECRSSGEVVDEIKSSRSRIDQIKSSLIHGDTAELTPPASRGSNASTAPSVASVASVAFSDEFSDTESLPSLSRSATPAGRTSLPKLPGAAQAPESLFGKNARVAFFDLCKESATQKSLEGQLAPTDSARLSYIDTCDDLCTMPLPLLIGRDTSSTINLNNYRLGDVQACTYLKALSKAVATKTIEVEELHIAHNGLSPPSMLAFADTLRVCDELRVLDLSGNHIGVAGATSIAAVLKSNSSIKKLFISAARLGDHGASKIVGSLLNNTSVTSLDLSNNKLGEASPVFVKSFSALLVANKTVTSLELGWNSIRGATAERFAEALHDDMNASLTSLSLAWNRLADAGACAIGKVLGLNKSLKKLDLTHNEIGERGAMVIADAMKENEQIDLIVLDENPLGRLGGRAVLRSYVYLAKVGAMHRDITISGCNLVKEPTGEVLFDPSEPTGMWICDLENPYERVIANELVEKEWVEHGENFISETLDDAAFQVPEPPAGVFWTRKDFRLPDAGILKANYRSTKHLPSLADVLDERIMSKLLAMMKAVHSTQALGLLKLASEELYFTTLDSIRLIKILFHENQSRTDALSILLHRSVDCMNWSGNLFDHFSDSELQLLGVKLGNLAYWSPNAATNHYRLNVKNTNDKSLVRMLQEMAASEKTFRKTHQLIDTSYASNYDNWRNVLADTLDGSGPQLLEELNAISAFPEGILEFDYVSTNTSHRIANEAPMSAAVFRMFLFQLKRASFLMAGRKASEQSSSKFEAVTEEDVSPERWQSLNSAALVLQSRWRSYQLYRAFVTDTALDQISEGKREKTARLLLNRLGLDINQRESIELAVLKIQSAFRGKAARARIRDISESCNGTLTAADVSTQYTDKMAASSKKRSFTHRSNNRPCWHVPYKPSPTRAGAFEEKNWACANLRMQMLRRSCLEHYFSVVQLQKIIALFDSDFHTVRACATGLFFPSDPQPFVACPLCKSLSLLLSSV